MDVLRLELGLRIPEDVGVIGFDDVPQAAWGAYQLTTVCQRVEPMVDAAVTLLRERMSGQAPARDIVVPCVLVERKTVVLRDGFRLPPGTGTRRVRTANRRGRPGLRRAVAEQAAVDQGEARFRLVPDLPVGRIADAPGKRRDILRAQRPRIDGAGLVGRRDGETEGGAGGMSSDGGMTLSLPPPSVMLAGRCPRC